jgi:hypothetical protein
MKLEKASWVLFCEADAFLPAHKQFGELFSKVEPVIVAGAHQD